ncbi:MAG: isoaspartyl peptidase/L-asparaginase family protein [bacterium]|nr:isoaspartyl peptidase/L-asparaginase family protein [bacterium]
MVVIVHGGAGKIENMVKRRKAIIEICKLGYGILKNGGTAIDAVERVIVELEDNPFFNAGTGAVLNIEGEAELDAAIMMDDMACGAVACIKKVKNPILVARKVMEETDHVMLVGDGATRFARLTGFPPYNPVTARRKKMLQKGLKELKEGKTPHYLSKIRKFIQKFGTVGACAIDKEGKLASATSTGGTFMRLPGRVGDTPLIGAGTYACEWGAVSCTGHGECIIKLCLAKTTCDAMKSMNAQKAINLALKIAGKHGCECGLIGIDKRGGVGFGFNTDEMIWTYIKNGESKHF